MRSANRRIRELIEQDENAAFVDIGAAMLADTDGPPAADLFVKDGLHMSQKGYALWADLVREAIPAKQPPSGGQ